VLGRSAARLDIESRIAEQLTDTFDKQTMLEIATSYEKLAVLAETGAVSKPSS